MTTSAPPLLVLHAVGLLGVAGTTSVANRFGLPEEQVGQLLTTYRAQGLVTWTSLDETSGWALTDAGRLARRRLLDVELDATDRRHVVRRTHLELRELAPGLLQAVTDWRVRPGARWDPRVLHRLAGLGGALAPLTGTLTGVLRRFGGYAERFESALARARSGDRAGVDGLDADSCLTVWFELDDDLRATLDLPADPEPG